MKRRDFLTTAIATAAAAAAANIPAAAQAARKGFDFIQVDVFTQTPLEGNPLAVFPHAQGMSDQQTRACSAFAPR